MATAHGTPDPSMYLNTLVQYMDTTTTGRSHLRGAVTDSTMPPERNNPQQRPLLPRSGVLTGNRPAQGQLTSADRAVLKEREERGIWQFHRGLASLGDNIMTCRHCGVRKRIESPATGRSFHANFNHAQLRGASSEALLVYAD